MRSLCESGEFNARNASNADFVEAVYRGLLGRASDPGGKQSWIAALQSGASRSAVIGWFLGSPEFANRQVTIAYPSLLGRVPDSAGLASRSAAIQSGVAIQVQLREIVTSAEYQARAAQRF